MMMDVLMWPFYHESTFWALIIMFFIGLITGLGARGQWRNWFD